MYTRIDSIKKEDMAKRACLFDGFEARAFEELKLTQLHHLLQKEAVISQSCAPVTTPSTSSSMSSRAREHEHEQTV
jgi:hypothetical protein